MRLPRQSVSRKELNELKQQIPLPDHLDHRPGARLTRLKHLAQETRNVPVTRALRWLYRILL
jgi:hypothetical protein